MVCSFKLAVFLQPRDVSSIFVLFCRTTFRLHEHTHIWDHIKSMIFLYLMEYIKCLTICLFTFLSDLHIEVKIGQNMNLVPGIARTLRPLVLRMASLYIEWSPGLDCKKMGDSHNIGPKIRKSGKSETCAFRRQSRLQQFCRLSSDWLSK